MKNAIGGYGILTIAIFFIVLFASFLSASVNYSKAFKIKNEIINIIERNEGFTTDPNDPNSSLNQVLDYMHEVGYRTTGDCEESDANIVPTSKWVGYNTSALGETYTDPIMCIKSYQIKGSGTIEVPDQSYYQVRVFYKMDIPILSSFFSFKVEGTSKIVVSPK